MSTAVSTDESSTVSKIKFAQSLDKQVGSMESSLQQIASPESSKGGINANGETIQPPYQRPRLKSEAPYLSPKFMAERNAKATSLGSGFDDNYKADTAPVFHSGRLPHGGVSISTVVGTLLISCPPNTLTDLYRNNLPPPNAIVIPEHMFNAQLGISLGVSLSAVEHLALDRLWRDAAQNPLTIVANLLTRDRLINGLENALLMTVKDSEVKRDDYSAKFDKKYLPKISKEIGYLRRFLRTGDIHFIAQGTQDKGTQDTLTVNDLLRFKCFDKDEDINDNCAVEIAAADDSNKLVFITEEEGHGGAYKFTESVPNSSATGYNTRKMTVSSVLKLQDTVPLPRPVRQFTPPLFGVTVLGNSTASDRGVVDADTMPTGYIIWCNRRGILVNPPPYAAARMATEYGIHPGLICDVIVTSVRECKEGGVLQKILQEEQVTLHTTKTLYNRLVNKYSAISGLTQPVLESASTFRQIVIGTPMKICGANFEFFYNVDASATLGFVCHYSEKKIMYAGGFTLSRNVLEAMKGSEVMTEGRMKRLTALSEETYDQIFYDLPHASDEGVGQILETLTSLPPPALDVLLVGYCPNSAVMPPTLKRSPDGTGEDSTIAFDVPTPLYSSATNLIETVEKKVFFKGLSIEHAASLIQIAEKRNYKEGETICKNGEIVNFFSIIVSGKVKANMQRLKIQAVTPEVTPREDMKEDDDEKGSHCEEASPREREEMEMETFSVVWGTGDCFGEEALIFGKAAYEAIAATDLEVIQIADSDLQWILTGTPVRSRIQRVHDMRAEFMPLENVLAHNSLLSNLTRAQKLALEMSVVVETAKKGSCIWQRGDDAEFAVILVKGKVLFPNAIAKLMSGLMKKSGTMMIKNEDMKHNYCPDMFTFGAFIGNVVKIRDSEGCNTNTLQAVSDCVYFKIGMEQVEEIVGSNPGLFLALGASEFVL